MPRGHLDAEVATMPASAEDAEKVIKNAESVLGFSRDYGIPIIHVKLVFRKIPGLGSEGMPVKFWKALHDISDEANRLTPNRPSTVYEQNIIGSGQTYMIPRLFAD